MSDFLKEINEKMQKAVDNLNSEYTLIKAGRANPAILDKIKIDYYGTETPINQVAAISVSEARVLTVQPWDMSAISKIEKAIQKSDLDLNPQSDGKVIRITFPQLTEDRRKEISKEVSKLTENSKISIRNIRKTFLEKLRAEKKSSEISEDELKKYEKIVQDQTNKFCDQIENLCKNKTKQIMEL
ncbi:MAG: ribosome recycling factor [Candidatus Paraimprobicoccus trichonymphae]|uniref:Ribosome-recycling factor n=1 Tax=Candidatus Paraimprobicoccus trichonymphae TaxID=3033793 RepID=A0AA48HZ48_9FIRM|nr:MAG: ribosome recycling factor [Candidatus Paraimprobicoccus trichonymphae]